MMIDLIDLLSNTNDFVCTWRNGELYIEPVSPPVQVYTDERLAA
jgi:hypothetical protein